MEGSALTRGKTLHAQSQRDARPSSEVLPLMMKRIELEQQSTKPQPHESKDISTQPKATNDQGHSSCHGNKLPEPVDTPIPSQNPAPFAGAVGDAQNNHSTEAETVPVLDEEFDESDAEVIPEMGKSKTKEKSKEMSVEEAGVLNTLQKPQTANTTAPDAFENDPVFRFAKSNLPGFYEQVRKGEGTACRMQELLMFMKKIAEDEGLLYESCDGFPMEHTVGYAISDDCRIPSLGLVQLWPNQRNNGSWFGVAIIDALVKLNIREVHDPTRMFLSTDDLVGWLTYDDDHSVEKMLCDVLRYPHVTLQANGRTNFQFLDTQQEPPRLRELTFPPIPDDVDTVLFPYCPHGNHWVAVEIVADSLSRLTVSVFNSMQGREFEFEYAKKELGLLARVLRRVQANGGHGMLEAAPESPMVSLSQQTTMK
ncbi:hypothetical protein SLS58_007656 [Diplodia intermedia]|uniref:Ubiquitin-like protease family profile domain-containing protein n=1 Tax=Diplodia intermedia TaxID=856260 RepID=A0ABR3TJM4_9PEZI